MQKEQLPPNDIPSEQALLGSLLIDPHSYSKISDIVQAQDFFRESHRHVFAVISEYFMAGNQKKINHVSVAFALQQRGFLADSGNKDVDALITREELSEMIRIVPTSVHIVQYAEDVATVSRRRQLIEAGKKIIDFGFDTESDLDQSLVESEDEILKVRGVDQSSDLTLIKESMDEHLENLSKPIGSDDDDLIKTGYSRLNEIMGGFYPGDMLVLAARPSIGKSMLAFNFAYRIAKEGKRVVIFSLEMGSYEVGMRLLATAADVSMHNIRTRRVGNLEREKLVNAVGDLSDMQIYVDESSTHSIGDIRSKLLRLHRSKKIDFVIIDYLQLISGIRRDTNRTQEVSEISRGVKALARDLKVPVLAISQLNRDVEKKVAKPMLSNLRDSGSIEQDADVVMFIHREDKLSTEREWNMARPGEPYPKNIAELIIAKHRHGPTGSVSFVVKEDRGIVEEQAPPARTKNYQAERQYGSRQ